MKHSGILLTIATLAFAITPSAQAQSRTPFTPFGLDPKAASPRVDVSPSSLPFVLLATEAPEAAAPQPSTGWDLSLAFPVWIPGISGDINIRGVELSPDQDTSDVIDILDTHLNAAFVMHFEAQKGRFGFFVDTLWIDLRSVGTLGVTDAEASLKGFIGELAGFYTLVPPEAGKRGWGTFRLDGLAGVRVTSLKIGIDADNITASKSNETLIDPMVGARLEFGIFNWMSLKARGDIGGFGIDAWSTSEFSYNVETGLEFHVAEWFDIGLGYRWLKYDFESDSGESTFDATLSGPYFALKFNF